MSGIIGGEGSKSGTLGGGIKGKAIFFSGHGGNNTAGGAINADGHDFGFNTQRTDRDERGDATNFDTSNGRYTIPKTGYYHISIFINGDTGTTANSAIGWRIIHSNYHASNPLIQGAAIGYVEDENERHSGGGQITRLSTVGDYIKFAAYIITASGSPVIHQTYGQITYLGA